VHAELGVGAATNSTTWGVLDKNATWMREAPRVVCPRSDRVRAVVRRAALGHAAARHREKAIGVGNRLGGPRIRRAVVEDTSGEWFDCDLVRSDGRRWDISDVPRRRDGVRRPCSSTTAHRKWRAFTASDQQTGKPYTYLVPPPAGFVIETRSGVVVGVERAFDGKVVLSPRDVVARGVCRWRRSPPRCCSGSRCAERRPLSAYVHLIR
jgi:hypothetical protein